MVKLSALLKPKDTAVAAMSFSIDRGMQTVFSPLRCSLWRMLDPAAADDGNQRVDLFRLQLFQQIVGHVEFLDHLVFVDPADMERVDPGRLAQDPAAGRIQVLDQLGG